MSEIENEMVLQNEDRLPWLEAVEPDDDDDSVSNRKLIGFVLVALAALGLVVGGVWWLRGQSPGPKGDGTLIAAQTGDYKIKPDAPGGMKVEGQGDSTFATSEGAEANGKVDVSAKPETPVVVQKPPTPTVAKPAIIAKPAVTTPMPPSGGKLVAPAVPGTLIQLGAYNSESVANAAWAELAKKTPALGKLPKSIVAASVGGKTFYRLRANAGSPANAAAMCGQVGNCMVVR